MASAIVEANKRLSDIQGAFQDRGEQFFKGYNKALETKKKREEANKATQQRISDLMRGFKNDIDLVGYSPEEQALVTNTVIGWRSEYANLASEAAKIQDKTSAEALAIKDKMRGIEQRMVSLKNNLDNYAAWKMDYKANHDAGFYSNAGSNDIALAQSETMLAYPISGITEDGDLNWSQNEDLGTVSFKNYKEPFAKAQDKIGEIAALAKPYRNQKTALTEGQKAEVSLKIDAILNDKNTLDSILSDSDMPAISTEDLDPENPESKNILKQRILNYVYNETGSLVSTDKNDKGGGNKGPRTTAIIRPEIQGSYKEMQDLEKEIMTTPITPGVTEAPEFTGGAKTWSIGPKDNPSKIRIKLDPQKRKWVYFDAGSNVRAEYDSIEELTKAYPSLFFK